MSRRFVLKNKRATFERIEKFISPMYFTDCNLFGRLQLKSTGIKSIKCVSSLEIISFEEACKREYANVAIGQSFGPSWSTHWFKLEIEIPLHWAGCEVRLVWDTGSEALIWKDGEPVQGLSSSNRRIYFILTKNFDPISDKMPMCLYIEMACNDVMGVGGGGLIRPPNPEEMFTLKRAEIVVFERKVFDLLVDLEVLLDIVKNLPDESHRGYQALYLANDIVNLVQDGGSQSYIDAHKLALNFFNEKNGTSQHLLYAVGHCHIDTAWLWPYRETRRKCARSFSSVLCLMDEFPNFMFACSQAQQYDWVKQDYPKLYERMKKKIKEGRFLPVGGTWVEMDCNIPSGESLVRQFLIGHEFFMKEFGMKSTEFWLPDTFGYSGQLPQIMKLCGMHRFITQKMSWNLVNKFPHHTFWWQGIDGSQVLAHFPPGDSYSMEATPSELLSSAKNFRDKGRSNCSLFLFGYGDGGQGPTEEMLERLTRMKDVDSLPRVVLSSVDEFFKSVEKQSVNNLLCTWRGELFLELHNATYTTHADVKYFNRRCEVILRSLELVDGLSNIVYRSENSGGNAGEIERLWKLLLLNQFHDVLPGTSIQMVYEDATHHYKDILTSGSLLLDQSLKTLMGENRNEGITLLAVFNTLSWKRKECFTISSEQFSNIYEGTPQVPFQRLKDGNVLVLVEVPSVGYSAVSSNKITYEPCSIQKIGGNRFCMQNGLLTAIFDEIGHLIDIKVFGDSRNAIANGCHGNQLLLFDDIPLYWDAWDVMDYHLETRSPQNSIISEVEIVEDGPLRVALKVQYKIGSESSMEQIISLDAGTPYIKFHSLVSWFESHKFLKVEFPLNVLSPRVTYEIQFGHLERPTHFNTSWDSAKYEVCGHKWADLSEYDFGVSVLNDCKYGWSCIDNNLRLSLLRSSKSPDKTADMGHHEFTFAVMPHTGTFQKAGIIQSSYNLNHPLLLSDGPITNHSFIDINNPAVILEAFKSCERNGRKYVVRLYEAYGSHASATITFGFRVDSIKFCDLLEYETGDIDTKILGDSSLIDLTFSPFQIISLVITVL